jgi:hypothetical protein
MVPKTLEMAGELQPRGLKALRDITVVGHTTGAHEKNLRPLVPGSL